MNKYDALTKFIPALDMCGLGEWVEDGDAVRVEYWDVVFRFDEKLEAFYEGLTDAERKSEGGSIVEELVSAFKREEECPGVVLGYLENGTVVSKLKRLRAIDEQDNGL